MIRLKLVCNALHMRYKEMLAQFHAMLIMEMVAWDCAIFLHIRSQFQLSQVEMASLQWMLDLVRIPTANSSFQANGCNFDRTHWYGMLRNFFSLVISFIHFSVSSNDFFACSEFNSSASKDVSGSARSILCQINTHMCVNLYIWKYCVFTAHLIYTRGMQ